MKRARLIEQGRGAVKLCALAAVIGWAALVWLMFPGERRDRAARARWLQRTCRRALRVLGVRVSQRGAAPGEGAFLAANHLGYLDVLVLGAATPVVFVAKKEVRAWPVFGWMAAAAGTCYIDRQNRSDVVRVVEEIRSALEAGASVVVFPEGTSTDGSGVLPFRSSLLQAPVELRRPVWPVALDYKVSATRSVAKEVAWWGAMTLGPHLLNLATLPWIGASIGWGAPISSFTDRKHLAMMLKDAVWMARSANSFVS